MCLSILWCVIKVEKNDVEQEWFWKSFIKMKNITDTLVGFFLIDDQDLYMMLATCVGLH